MSFGSFLGKIAPTALAVAAIAVTGGAAAPFLGAAFAAGATGAIALAAGAALAGSALGAINAKRAAKRAAARAATEAARGQAVHGNVSGSTEAHQVIFGTLRVGGLILNTRTFGALGVNLQIFVAHSLSHTGGIEGVKSIFINEKRIPTTVDALVTESPGTSVETRLIQSRAASGDLAGMVEVRTYLGLHTQQIGSDIVATGISTANDDAKGIAWSRFVLTRDLANDPAFQRAFGGGIPTVSMELLGLKCYDPRLDSTQAGGSGGQRAYDATTWAWTDNAALVLLTYLIMRKADGGCGEPITSMDYPAFAAAASICDAPIGPSGSVVRKFAFSGALNTADDCDTNVDRICTMMAGDCWLDITTGLWTVRAGGYTAPVATITDDWLAGGVSVTNGSGLNSLYNAVRATFSSPAALYGSVEAYPFTNAAYEAEDGGQRLYRDLSLPCCINEYQAQYLAQIEGRRSRNQRRVSLTLNLYGLTVRTGQTVQLALSNLDEIGGSNVYLIESQQLLMTSEGLLLVSVGLVEERSDTYEVATFGAPSASTTYPDLYETPDAPVFLSVTPVADGLALQWLPPPSTTYTVIEVEVSISPGGPFSLIASPKGDRLTYPETTGALLYFRLRALNAQGQYSTYSTTLSSAGKMVADGADVSALNVQALILNPSFDAGDIYWIKGIGWGIVNDPTNSRSGRWVARFTGGTAAVTNVRRVPATPGSVVTNEAWFKRTSDADGYAEIRIEFRNAAGVSVNFANTSLLAGSTNYTQTRIVAVAPAASAYAEISFAVYNRTTGTWYVDDFNVEYHVSDVLQTPPVLVNGLGAVVTTSPLTAHNDGSVDVNAFTVQIGSRAVSYNAVTNAVTGLSNGAYYYIYTDDPTYAGGTRTYGASTNAATASNVNGRVSLGRVIIPASGGGSTTPDPVTDCVAAASWLPDGRQAKTVRVGDIFIVIDADETRREVELTQATHALAEGLLLCTESGLELECSTTAPFDLQGGGTIRAPHMLGRKVRAENAAGDLGWEVVTSIQELGRIPVMHITAGNSSFAASRKRGGPYIYSHNAKIKY